MLTKTLRLLLTFSLFVCCAAPLCAQKKVIEENDALEEEIEELGEKYAQLVANKAATQEKVDSLEREKAEEEEAISFLEKALSKEGHTALQHTADSLAAREKTLDNTLSRLRKEIDGQEKRASAATKDLERRTLYKEEQLKAAYEKDKAYLTRRYSQMSPRQLDRMREQGRYSAFADYAAYRQRLAATINNKVLYDAAVEALHERKSVDEIETLRNEIISLILIENDNPSAGKFKLSEEQYEEMLAMNRRLFDYRNSLQK